ncbi:MAG: hypothetical protein MZV70_15990 [Desulfobacterales bacterium]|nr:hypothetical protein [Desulfobacterales bacterium]
MSTTVLDKGMTPTGPTPMDVKVTCALAPQSEGGQAPPGFVIAEGATSGEMLAVFARAAGESRRLAQPALVAVSERTTRGSVEGRTGVHGSDDDSAHAHRRHARGSPDRGGAHRRKRAAGGARPGPSWFSAWITSPWP